MTRNATFCALAFALLTVTSAFAGVGAATPTSVPASDVSPAPLAQETTTGNQSGNATSVTFGDQTSNGSAVVVDRASLPQGGFLVIFAQDGSVLGNSSYLRSGTSENVTVQLNETLNRSQVLVAVPHQDTNDNQQFDFNATKARQIARSTTTPNASNVSVEDIPYTQGGMPISSVAFVTVSGGGNQTGTGNSSARVARPA